MRRLNVKRLACLILVTALLGGSTYFLHGFQVKRNAGSLLHQSEQAEKEGHLDKAADLMERYLGLVPGDMDALAKYGSLLDTLAEKTGRPKLRANAFFVLDRVVSRRPDAEDVRRHLIRIALHPTIERFLDAEVHLKALLERHPNDEELESMRGRCLEARGEFEKAQAEYVNATDHAKEHGKPQVEVYVRLATLLRHRLHQAEKADGVMNEMIDVIEKAPGVDSSLKAHAYLARSRDFRDRGPLTDAVQELAKADMAKARALAADDADVLVESAELARELARPENGADEARVKTGLDEARQYMQRGLELHPKDVRLYQALARIEMQANKPKEAIACLHRGIQAVPDGGELYWSLAELLLDTGETGEVTKLVADLRQKGYSANLLDYLEARVLAGKGEWLQAANALERIQPVLERSPALAGLAKQAALALGKCYERLGDLDRRYAAYQRAVNLDPLWLPGCLGMGATLTVMGKLDEALDIYQRIAPRAPAARIVVARLLVLRTLREPEDRRSWKEVEQFLDQAARALRNPVEVVLLQAEVAANQEKKLDKAKLILEEALRQNDKLVEARIALVNLAAQKEKAEKVETLFDEVERDLGDSVELRLARATYWARNDKSKEHAKLAQLTKDLDRFSADDQDRVLRGVAQAFVRADDNAAAEKLWAEVAKRQPHDLGVRLVLFDLALQAGNDAAMDGCLREMQAIEGSEGTLWRYGKACQLLRQAQAGNKEVLSEARTLLAEVGKRRPTWGRVVATAAQLDEVAAQLDEVAGNAEQAITGYKRAIAGYERAIEMGDQRPAIVLRLVKMLPERERSKRADHILRLLPEYATLSGPLQQLSANIDAQNLDFGRALEKAKKAVKDDSKDYREHLWLGQLHRANNQMKEAEASLNKALELAPDKPEVWVALIGFLADSDRKQEAEARLKEAEGKLSREKAALDLAKCYEFLARWDDAEKLYAAALAAQPRDVNTLRAATAFYWQHGQAAEARKCLETLSTLKGKSAPEAAWAKRMLTILIALDRDYQKAEEALKALDRAEGDKEGDLSAEAKTENLRTRVMVLSLQPDPGKRLEAIKILETMKNEGRLAPEDRYLLAQLYEVTGEWPRAREMMLSLVGAGNTSPVFLLRMAASFLRENEVDVARTCLTQIKKAASPQALAPLVLEAHILKAEGKVSPAVELLQKYATGTKEANLLQVAGAIEQIKPPAAEEYYRKYVEQSKQPESVLVLAVYLGRQNRANEGLDLCERAWRTCPAAAVAFASVGVLSTVQATQEQLRRVDRWLGDAMTKEGMTPALTFDLANLRNLQGRFQEAEALYRKLLDQPKPIPEALNNLAWLLAFRGEKSGEALEIVKRAIAVAGPHPDVIDTRGVIELRAGQVDKALQDLQAAASQSPSPTKFFHLAQANLALKKRDEAVKALGQAQKLGLKLETLHPLERDAYQPLLNALQ
jgi:cellulose synthase operon protein C